MSILLGNVYASYYQNNDTFDFNLVNGNTSYDDYPILHVSKTEHDKYINDNPQFTTVSASTSITTGTLSASGNVIFGTENNDVNLTVYGTINADDLYVSNNASIKNLEVSDSVFLPSTIKFDTPEGYEANSISIRIEEDKTLFYLNQALIPTADDIAHAYLPLSGGTISGTLTVSDVLTANSVKTTEINGIIDENEDGFVLKSGSSSDFGLYSSIEISPTSITVSSLDFKVNGANIFYDSNELDIVDLNANIDIISSDSIAITDLRSTPILKLKLNTLEGVTDATYDLSALKFTQIPNVAATREIWLDTTDCDVTTDVDGTETTLTPTIIFPSTWKWLEYGALTTEVPADFVSGRVYHIVVRSEGFKDTVDGEEVWGPIVANLAYYYDSSVIGANESGN